MRYLLTINLLIVAMATVKTMATSTPIPTGLDTGDDDCVNPTVGELLLQLIDNVCSSSGC